MEKIWIALVIFFTLLALWLLLKCIILPLWGPRMKRKMARFIGWTITRILLGICVALFVAVLLDIEIYNIT